MWSLAKVLQQKSLCGNELPASNEELGISGISTSDSAVGLAAGSTKEDWSCGVSVIS